MSNPVTHFYLLGENPEELTRFYSDLFGWAVHDHPEAGASIIQTGDVGDPTAKIGAPEPDNAQRLIPWVEVDDIDAVLAAVEALGGRVETAPAMIEGGGPRAARIVDPSGNLVGISYKGREAFVELKKNAA